MKGIFEFEVNNKKVGIRFGTRAFRLLQRKLNKTLSEILDDLGKRANEIDFLCDFFECAAQDYYITHKKEIDFNNEDMPDWIDAIGGLEPSIKVLTDGIEQYLPKNSTSLAETGEKVTL